MTSITVYGIPAPQGSKKFMGVRKGRGIMIESSKKVKPWREAVKLAAVDSNVRVQGAVQLLVTFSLPRPKKYARKPAAMPSSKPDLSKLIRSTEDALTDAGAWEDDARVVCCIARKLYVGAEGAMDRPGAVIDLAEVAL